MNRALSRLGNGLLTGGAVLGAVCLVLVALGPLLGVRPLLFRSGSMTPTIDTGDVALVRSVPAAAIEVGDIVSVRTAGGDRVTHRVVDVVRDGERAALTLRGDGNDADDPEPYAVSSADRVFLVVPWVGRAIAAAGSPEGMFLLGVGAAGLLALAVRGGPGGGSGSHRGGRRGRRRSTGAKVLTGAAMAVVVPMAAPASGAPVPWTDPVAVNGTVLTSSSIPAPTLSCGALGVLSVTFNWTSVPGATGYQLTAGGTTYPVQSTTSLTVVSVISGGTATVRALRNFGSVTWTSVPSNQRTYTVAVASVCS